MIEIIRRRIPREEFDYQMLLDALAGYARPRDKITRLLAKGVVVRIKKGLYIFGDGLRHKPYSPELLANLIYGPSYLSLEWALQFYGLIPEGVAALTSVTTGRSREFHTPAGLFSYHRVPLRAFTVGMTRREIDGETAFLVATPEKALADKVRLDRGAGISRLEQMAVYLTENLRIDEAALHALDPHIMGTISRRYRSRKIGLVATLIARRAQGKRRHYG